MNLMEKYGYAIDWDTIFAAREKSGGPPMERNEMLLLKIFSEELVAAYDAGCIGIPLDQRSAYIKKEDDV